MRKLNKGILSLVQRALNTFKFKRNLLYSVVVLISLCLIGLMVYQTVFVRQIHSQRATQDFNQEFGAINRLLLSDGLSKIGTTSSLNCNNLAGDQPVRINCTKRQEYKRPADTQFMDEWQTYYKGLEQYLNGAGWVKQPNLDPVTTNPITSLDRLFEYRGAYSADVTYAKKTDFVDCELRVELAEKSAGVMAFISFGESCSSISE